MKLIYIHIFLLLLFIIGCQKSEEVEFYPSFKPQLVGITFIAAGEGVVTSTFQYSRPVFKDPIDTEAILIVPGIKATLFNNGTSIPITYDSVGNNYQALLPTPAMPGESFSITATDGNQIITGSTTLPKPADIEVSFTFDSLPFLDVLFKYNATITYTLKGNEAKYVRIIPRIYFTNGNSDLMIDESFKPIPKLLPGQSLTQQFRIVKPEEMSIPDSIECIVLSCDEAYVKYANSTLFSLFDFFPGTEPTMHYSNMSNKIGVIASYTQSDSKILKIKK